MSHAASAAGPLRISMPGGSGGPTCVREKCASATFCGKCAPNSRHMTRPVFELETSRLTANFGCGNEVVNSDGGRASCNYLGIAAASRNATYNLRTVPCHWVRLRTFSATLLRTSLGTCAAAGSKLAPAAPTMSAIVPTVAELTAPIASVSTIAPRASNNNIENHVPFEQ